MPHPWRQSRQRLRNTNKLSNRWIAEKTWHPPQMIDSEFPIKEENMLRKAERRGGWRRSWCGGCRARSARPGRPARRGAALPRHAAVASRAGCGHRQAAPMRRGAKRPAADRAERIPATVPRARADRPTAFSRPISMPSTYGRAGDGFVAQGTCGRVLGRCERAGNPRESRPSRSCCAPHARPDALLPRQDVVHGAEPGAGTLWRLAAAQYAAADILPKILPHDWKTGSARAMLCRRLQAGRRWD